MNESVGLSLVREAMQPAAKFVFDSLKDLVEHCKKFSIMLHLEWLGHDVLDPEHGSLTPLFRAIALPPTIHDPFCKDGVIGQISDLWITEKARSELSKEIERDDSDIRRLWIKPIERTFLYLDVSDFSKYPAGHQALIINSIAAITRDQQLWEATHTTFLFGKWEAMICTGDGYIFVFNEPAASTYFGGYLAFLIETMVAKRMLPVEFHFRMGINTGPVYTFWDPDRNKWNYVGEGINGGQRVLDAVGKDTDDVVFISDYVRQEIIAQRERFHLAHKIIFNLHSRGRRLDKHGKPWRVYELNHSAMCGAELPPGVRDSQRESGN
jgi:hypothetical protein